MNLGIEYLVRSGLIREFMEFPCSIFVKSGYKKIIVTINKANNGHTEHCTMFSVRNFLLHLCEEKSPLPPMTDHMVRDVDLFHHEAVVVRDFAPLYFDCNSIEWKRNRGNGGHPMPLFVYNDYFANMLYPKPHKIKREKFLWESFTQAYIPSIDYMIDDKPYVGSWYPGPGVKADKHKAQQKIIESNFKVIWAAWRKWQKLMLFDTVPGELIFMKDYAALAPKPITTRKIKRKLSH